MNSVTCESCGLTSPACGCRPPEGSSRPIEYLIPERAENQCKRVMEYLEINRYMTQSDADKLGIKRLASRVSQINKDAEALGEARPIISRRIPVIDKAGQRAYVAQYTLSEWF